MSDTTEPTPHPQLAGISDFLATVKVYRPGPDDLVAETGEIRFRIPAGDPGSAHRLASSIAWHLADAGRRHQVDNPTAGGDGPRPWQVNVLDVTVTETSGPSVDELLAQIQHWQRIVTALATRFPMMAQISHAEYAAADPSGLVIEQAGPESMLFTVPAAYAAIMNHLAQNPPGMETTEDPADTSPGRP